MRERDWLTRDDPVRMLRYLRRRMSRRKLRLFIAEAYLPLNQGWAPLDEAELAALPAELELWSSGVLEGYERQSGTVGLRILLGNMAEGVGFHLDFARLVWDNDWLDAHRLSKIAANYTDDAKRFADLLRDIAGNPFRPVTLDPEWLTPTVLQLARGIYESRDFSTMPILADALQDAGCDNADVLNHCRDQSLTHVRGCWVVDMLLGKS